MRRPCLASGLTGVLLVATPLLAHHDWLVDTTKRVTLHGTVSAFTWGNPHVMISLDVEANGTTDTWRVGGSSPKFMTACGWDKKTLKAGDIITATIYRIRDGSTAGRFLTLTMPNGKEMHYGAPTPLQCVPSARDSSSTGAEGRPQVGAR